MGMYTDFAGVYDIFMDETPYEEWCSLIDGWIREYGISKKNGKEAEENLVVDLGCGTGTLTEMLAGLGYDCIGIDNSMEMLGRALDKREAAGTKTLYLCQNMQEMELYSTVGTIISACDSLNYLLTEEEIKDTFSRVNNYLYPGGIFIFDFNTVFKYQNIIGDTTIAENRDECSFIWENYYHSDQQVNEYDITVFVREENDRYRKFEETHYQRGYTAEQMEKLLKQAGLELVLALDAETRGEIREDSQRIYMIAREQGKEQISDV